MPLGTYADSFVRPGAVVEGGTRASAVATSVARSQCCAIASSGAAAAFEASWIARLLSLRTRKEIAPGAVEGSAEGLRSLGGAVWAVGSVQSLRKLLSAGGVVATTQAEMSMLAFRHSRVRLAPETWNRPQGRSVRPSRLVRR